MQESAATELIHGIGDLAEQAAEIGFTGLFRVGFQHVPVLPELEHPHVPRRADGRHAPGGGEQKGVAVEELILREDADQGLLPIQHLVELHLIPAAEGFVGIVDTDLADAVPQKLQRRDQRPTHVAEAHHVQTLFGLCQVADEGFIPFRHVRKSGVQGHAVGLFRVADRKQPFHALQTGQIVL